MAITQTTPSQNFPYFSGLALPLKVPTALTVSTGGLTLTAAQALSGLLRVNCTDAGTLTLPTADLLVAAMPPGVQVGHSFDIDVINYGDSTLTVAVGTGGSKVTIASVSAVLTLATLVSKRFTVTITALKSDYVPGSSNTYVVDAYGSIAAAVA